MWKKLSFGIFVALCLAGGIYWFAYIRKVKAPVSDAITAIPRNAAIIFESRKSRDTWKKISQTNIMWEELLGTRAIAQLNLQGRHLDSLISLDPAISSLLEERSLLASLHPDKEKGFTLLFVYSLPNLTHKEDIEEFLQGINGNTPISKRRFENAEIGSIQSKGNSPLNYTFVNGILIFSQSPSLLELSIHQLASGISLADKPDFRRIREAAGKKADATVYINYSNLPAILNQYLRPGFRPHASLLSGFAAYSGWDITVKPNALMLSGFTECDDSIPGFLGAFRNQKPQQIELTGIIPSNTALMLFYGVSNMRSFHENQQKYLEQGKGQKAYQDFISSVNGAYHIDVRKSMHDWMENEMALVITEPSGNDLRENTFAVIRSNNIVHAQQSLADLTDSVNKAGEASPDTSSFRGHLISRIPLRELLPHLYGHNFKGITENYYTTIGNYIVFGNSAAALQSFITDAENNRTLGNDKNYRTFAENISSEASFYVYSAIGRSFHLYHDYLLDELAADLARKKELLAKFEAAGIQFSANNGSFYSNVYLKYNPSYKQETGTLWECALDTTISTKPYLLINHNTKAKEIFVQDDANKIYLISNTGKVIWTKQLNEKIMSDVMQVDALKNDKLQMVFNTQSSIYMFDRNGNDMKGFPVRLRSPATNAMAVIDYDNNRDYRFFIATENRRIVCYQANGEQLTAFKFDKTQHPVYLPLQYFSAAGKDHLCAVDLKGRIYIMNRQGEIRVKLKYQLPQGIRSFFIEPGKDYSRSYLLASDTLGNVIRLQLDGDKESLRFQDFETSPYFDYKDLNNDKTREYIFLTRHELKVFSQDKSLLFKHEFQDTISSPPLFFLFPDGTAKIGVVSGNPTGIYLFSSTGIMEQGFPLKGRTLFSIADLNNEGMFNLVTGGSDNSIYIYQLR